MSLDVIAAAVSVDPANGRELARYAYQSEQALDETLSRTMQAWRGWRDTDVDARAECVRGLARSLRANAEALARMATSEMGKPITQARAEVEKCAVLCDWYAEHGPAMLAPEPTTVEGNAAHVAFRPLGPVLAVLPWNFPYWQVIRCAVPLVLAGNAFVLKHAPNVMGCALQLEKVWHEAGFPESVLEVANVTPDLVSIAIRDDRIAAVTVTGSVRAGAAIAAQAGAALKKCVLELGGSDPFIVLDDADLDAAVTAAVSGRFQNTGQVCIAAKRFIVTEGLYAAFEEKLIAAVKALRCGDPMQDQTVIGPMARFDLRDELHDQVCRSIAEGARLLVGGDKAEGDGNFYLPTLLADVTPEMTSFREELFGPVASLIRARDADHAIALANDSEFGLASSIWTAEVATAHAMAARLETGAVFINGNVASDPRVPIGGIKKSGFGRELSHFGIKEFCNAQTVWQDRR